MTREEFIKKSLAMGVGMPFFSSMFLSSCDQTEVVFPELQTDFTGKVLIVGAGAAGLAAGYLLNRYGVDFQIVEASSVYGGRLKKADGFADFPIDIGAEWIHTDPKVLADIVNDPNKDAKIDIIVYNPQTIKTWKNGRLKSHHYIKNFYSEWKFKSTTWFGFFEEYIVPEVIDKITLNSPIVTIDYSADQVKLTSLGNETYQADKVLITVPIKTLQNERISFVPALPAAKSEAINQISMGDGIKVFMQFRERFYPDFVAFGNIFSALNAEEKFLYDAAFRKGSDQHVLGLFAINEPAAAYARLGSDEEIIAKLLAELDEMFDGKASANYLGHLIQNWTKEPYIEGAYSYEYEGGQKRIIEAISAPVKDQIYFAGEALSQDNHATVHGACGSAYETVANMLKS